MTARALSGFIRGMRTVHIEKKTLSSAESVARLRAGLATRIFRVILPNVRFGLIAALFLTFVLSWEEIGVTLFITSVNAVTLPRLMWMGLRDNIDPAIAAISVVLIVVVVAAVLIKTAVGLRQGRKT